MGVQKDLNNPDIYVEALLYAALHPQREAVAAWLAGVEDSGEGVPVVYPFHQWYLYFADRLLEMMPRPDLGFRLRPKRTVAAPKIGRNDPCPCGSGKKHKQCHLVTDGGEEVTAWHLGTPTPTIYAMAVARLIHQLPLASLDRVPLATASAMAIAEMATIYHKQGQQEQALSLLKRVLDSEREDPYLLFDYWIARYVEWLVESGQTSEGERFLLDEYDNPRNVAAWQVAQKLAAFYIDQGDIANAETWVAAALDGDAQNPFSYYLKGLLAHFDGEWDAAIAAYTQANTFSERFRDEKKAYMSQLVTEALERAENRQPMDDEEESSAENGDASAVVVEDVAELPATAVDLPQGAGQ